MALAGASCLACIQAMVTHLLSDWHAHTSSNTRWRYFVTYDFFILTNEYLYLLKMCILLHILPLPIYSANVNSSVFKTVLRNTTIKYKKTQNQTANIKQTTEFCSFVYHLLLWWHLHVSLWETANKFFCNNRILFRGKNKTKQQRSDDVHIQSAAKTQVYLLHHVVGWKFTCLNSILSCSTKNHWVCYMDSVTT